VAVPDGELVWHDCPYPVPDEPMRCGTLHVPEDYDRPEGPRIALPVAVLPATGGAPAPDHILYLNGGPGHSATSWLGVMARIGAPRADRDLVVLEQRGNGAAEPALICQENEEVRACHDRLLAQGIDLARYGTLDAARDAEALRRALGGPQVNLYGISYGTTLALQVLRLFPEGVRSVVLDSPSAPDTDIAVADVTSQLDGLSRLFAACTADLGCARRFPGVRQAFLASVERLDAEPLPLRAEPLRALLGPELTGAALVGVAARVMQNRVLLPRTPALLDALGRGDDEAVLRLLDSAIPEPPPGFPAERATALGVTLSVYCAELPFSRFGREPLTTQEAWPEAVVAALTPDYWTSCVAGDWPVPPVDPVLLTQVQSDVPTLILLGEFDPISSRAEAGRAAAGLSNARIVTIPGATHGMTEVDPCAQGLMGAFLASPDGLLDTGCAEPGQELTFE
jgi:pimeloyl-ACP methyl ester carboxylesterase